MRGERERERKETGSERGGGARSQEVRGERGRERKKTGSERGEGEGEQGDRE